MSTDTRSSDVLDQIWLGDNLGRQDDAEWLEAFLCNRSAEIEKQEELRSYVLNLDAQWGGGKTFFLTRLKRQLENSGHLAVYVNAWRDDFADDPLVAVMAAIDETVEAHRELTPNIKTKWSSVKEKTGQIARIAGKGILKRGLGFIITTGAVEAAEEVFSNAAESMPEMKVKAVGSVQTTAEEISKEINKLVDAGNEREVSNFRKQQEVIQTFRENLADFISAVGDLDGKKAPFFILIDELDRCRPTYAIAMLERIKHLFETPGVVFIVATDSKQLSHAIKAVYGAGFESARYLRRFFDQVYEFDDPTLESFVNHLMERDPIDPEVLSSPLKISNSNFITDFFSSSGVDLRTAEQIYKHLQSLASSWRQPVPIELTVALPLIFSFHYRQPISDMKDAIKNNTPQRWRIAWKERDNNTLGVSEKKEDVINIAMEILKRIDAPLDKIASQGPAGGILSRWIGDQLIKEYDIRSGTRRRHISDMYSLILTYPSRISQAGRIRPVISKE